MKKTYISPETLTYKIEPAAVIAASPYDLKATSTELEAADVQFSRGADDLWDDDEY